MKRESHRPSNAEVPKSYPGKCWGYSWNDIAEALAGLGEIQRKVDRSRIQIPAVCIKRFRGFVTMPWMVSYWINGTLRVVPRCLWPQYKSLIAVHLDDNPVLFDEVIVKPAKEILAQRGNRWEIPRGLAALIGLDLPKYYERANLSRADKSDGGTDERRIILVPGYAWVEIWDEDDRAKYVQQLIAQGSDRSAKNPPESPVSLPPSGERKRPL